MRRRFALLLLLLCLGMSGFAGNTAAAEAADALPPAAEHPDLPPVRLYFDGLLRGRGYVYEDAVYLPPALLCEYYGLELKDGSDAERLRLDLPGVSLRGESGLGYLEAGGRYLYCPGGWLRADGMTFLPAEAVAHLFGLSITVPEDRSRADIGATGYRLLEGGEGYYALNFEASDLYWLSHIIYSESHLEPLAGQIGVGNVVLNRVADERFPSTVVTVALDEKQFDPVSSREALSPADETSLIAACLCLEGYNTVDGALYFVNADLGEAGWFQRELTPVAAIGHHVFYR